uniref:Premelanosome protein n=1 Tax=Ovis aries TaxID=9940 RepID=A0AC11B390_SHEEP
MDLVLRKYLLHVALMGVLLAVGATEGGHVSLKVSNDGPTLIGANASFSVALHFPKSQKVLPNGQVIWANNTIINGSRVWGGQLVYPQEPDDTCIFPDGGACPSGPLSQKRCFVYVWKTWEGIESAEILQAVSSSEGDAFELTVSCQGGLPKEACMDISSPGCQPPAQRLCQPVPPSPACQLVLHQVLKGGSGTYCLNVSLADANSLAMVSTQLVMPGQEAGLRQVPLFVGILLVLTALLLASLIYRRRLMKQGSAVPLPQLPHGRTQWLRLPWVFRSCPIGESKPLLSGQQV